jgi:thiol-disulfide isomerase/thioredoxin
MITNPIFFGNVARYVFALTVFATLLVGCKKETLTDEPAAGEAFTVAKQSNPGYFYFGATWCPPCGAYGKPALELFSKSIKNKDVAFIAYHMGDFNVPMCGALGSVLGAFSYPKSAICGNNQRGNISFYTDPAYTQQQHQSYLQTIMAGAPLCNTQIKANVAEGKVKIEYMTKFWDTANDSLFINFVVTENGLMGIQQNDQSLQKNIHDFVFRAQSSPQPCGDFLAAKASKEQVFRKSATIVYDVAWKKANLTLIALVWQKKQGVYSLVNTDKIKL